MMIKLNQTIEIVYEQVFLRITKTGNAVNGTGITQKPLIFL